MASIELITADAEDLFLGSLLAPAWGVYLNGAPVIQPASMFGQVANAILQPVQIIASLLGGGNLTPVAASTIEFEYAQDWPISTYPQEQGAFQAYDKVTLPFDVKLKLACGGSTSNRQAFLNACLAIGNSFSLFDIVTPERVFTSVNCTHIDWPRKAQDGVTLLKVSMWFMQVPVTASASFANTQQPGDAGQQGIGNVQPQTPSAVVSNGFSSGNFPVF